MKTRSDEHERNGEPERVHAEQQAALDRRVRGAGQHEDRGEDRADAGRRAHGERAAEQHPRAPAACTLQQTGTDESLRPGQQPHEGEAEDDEDEPGDSLEQELVAEEPAADERGADAEHHEDGREAEDERNARDDDATRGPGLAEPVRVDSGDRRQIAGDEREHARREERDEAREERDGDRAEIHVSRRSARAPRRRGARARGRGEALRPAPLDAGSSPG